VNQPNPHQAIYNIAALCAAHGLTEVVLSPGSRCAPLTLAFSRHPQTNVRVVPDERAAAFIGLGIAQARRVPTVLVCTSGTAGLNYAPAVAEAYYQQVPLLVLTADRPPEWIDQLDGQTIRQNGLYGPHVKGSFTFPTETTHPDAKWHANRLMNEAINLAKAYPPGPVHVNIPLREPLYPTGEVEFEEVRVIKDDADGYAHTFAAEALDPSYEELLDRVLIVVGQHESDEHLTQVLREVAMKTGAVVVADTISNVGTGLPINTRHDIFLTSPDNFLLESLRPDLLITVGNSLISKSLKLFLRKQAPKQHWHLQPHNGVVADPFRSLTSVLRVNPSFFLEDFAREPRVEKRKQSRQFGTAWSAASHKVGDFISGFFGDDARSASDWNEFHAFRRLFHPEYASFPADNTTLHLANSMAVRYANILGVPSGVEVFANRGTSGIDGCTSTAVGYALAQPEKQVVLLTGDVAFFYDRNAFWHNYPTPNLRVVLLNNHGGGIFRIIDGPRQQPELDEFFETRQQLTAENLCRDFHLPYFPVDSMAKLEAALPVFFGPEGAGGVLEIQTDSKVNAAFFEQYRAAVKQAFS
jgi:2-succinyl-5-enolpyruvyl-6-hydroxy-3-cyclohexene-1-carboxylate synthase